MFTKEREREERRREEEMRGEDRRGEESGGEGRGREERGREEKERKGREGKGERKQVWRLRKRTLHASWFVGKGERGGNMLTEVKPELKSNEVGHLKKL